MGIQIDIYKTRGKNTWTRSANCITVNVGFSADRSRVPRDMDDAVILPGEFLGTTETITIGGERNLTNSLTRNQQLLDEWLNEEITCPGKWSADWSSFGSWAVSRKPVVIVVSYNK